VHINRSAIENRELGFSSGKQGRPCSKKRNTEIGVYTKVGKYLFLDPKETLEEARR
jgi:hypothetical protein